MSRFNRQRRVEILSSPSGFGWQPSMMSYGAALICINRPFGFIGPRQYPFLTVCAIERLVAAGRRRPCLCARPASPAHPDQQSPAGIEEIERKFLRPCRRCRKFEPHGRRRPRTTVETEFDELPVQSSRPRKAEGQWPRESPDPGGKINAFLLRPRSSCSSVKE
jgi:molybdenum cofactor biosynthesis enzyme MoaA